MSGYEVEHNIPQSQQPTAPPRRPDLSTFFSTLSLVDTSSTSEPHHNAHALPHPTDMAAAYRLLANAFQIMRGDASNTVATDTTAANVTHTREGAHDELLTRLATELMAVADDPPTTLPGVPDSFLDGLERVPKAQLKKDDECPICGNPFLEDKYPLVVALPCHDSHWFDLDCVRPWLKLNPTCPLDRKAVWKEKSREVREGKVGAGKEGEEEEEWDDMYA